MKLKRMQVVPAGLMKLTWVQAVRQELTRMQAILLSLMKLMWLQGVRQELQDHLERINPDKDWSFITKQIGMFSFTGLTPQQVRICAPPSFRQIAT